MNLPIFHIHTYRCGHASLEPEIEYIKKAIELGATEIVFTDHCPFPNDILPYRMEMALLPDYVSTLQNLKQQFSSQITVKIGLEVEYFPSFHNYYKELIDSGDFDLLIIGPHFYEHEDGSLSYTDVDKLTEIKGFAKSMIQGIESGLFPVLAHPDRPFERVDMWDEEIDEIVKEIVEAALSHNVILEKNISSMHYGKKYRPEFWANVSKEVLTIYGVDAHSVDEMVEYYKVAQKLAEEQA